MDRRLDHRSVSLADQIFEKLEKDILSGVYNRGEIITEMKLSEMLGVSRTPVREAIRRLEQEHIITITSKGIEVCGISREDIESIYEIRVRIEGYAARCAAERITDDELNRLKETLELQNFYLQKGDAERIMDCDSHFHKLVYQATGRMPLCDTLTELHKKIIKFRRVSVELTERAQHSCEEHASIYYALAAHDGAKADALTVEHICNARENILKHMDK